jgi:putative hydrolase of HD superfamily
MVIFSLLGKEIYDLWTEYETFSTPEARLVKDFDKLEMIVQAFEYEKAQDGMTLNEFFDSTRGVFKHPQVASWASYVDEQRTKFQKEKKDANSNKEEEEKK